nr:hypothetical protein [uncultured archaeon]AQS32262.1 hypothetical protein [uncultured archaeon]
MFMSTKTITIAEDAYERLNALKKKEESFSEAIRRLTAKVKLTDFAGILTNEEAKNIKNKIAKSRELSNDRMRNVKEKLT